MSRSTFLRRRLPQVLGGLMIFVFLFEDYGASIDHAKITEVVNDVKVIDPASRSAVLAKPDDLFRAPELMKTGSQSRSEMVAEDQTITRVGADTLFSFEPRSRTINLRQGSILFQSQTGRGGGTIQTASATAAVLGTTIIVVATRDGGFKLLVIEGTGQVRMPNGRRIIVHGGQMVVIPPGGGTPGPVLNFLLDDQVRTSLLIRGFKRPLPSWPKIRKQILKQRQQIAAGQFQLPGAVLENNINPNTTINRIQSLPRPTPVAPPTPAPAPRPTPPPPPPRPAISPAGAR